MKSSNFKNLKIVLMINTKPLYKIQVISKKIAELFNIPYGTKFRWTKFSTDKIFLRTKFSTPSRNFDSFVRFLPDFCIEILDKIFVRQNFRHQAEISTFCPMNFCPIRYLINFTSVTEI